jgi:hypothetical protein
MWIIKYYVAANGESSFKNWYDNLGEDVRAVFDARLLYLKQQPRNGWSRPHFSLLHGPCAGLGEIRFKAKKIQYRPLGFFGPGPNQFTLLVGAIERGDQLQPPSACASALKYMSALNAHRTQPNPTGGSANDWVF